MFKFKSTAAVLMPSSAGTPYLRPSPLDIPEILERIFSSLNRRTVLHLVRRVCRQWYHVSRRLYSYPLVFCDATSRPKDFENILKRLPYAGCFHWKPPSSLSDKRQQWIALRDVLEHMSMEKAIDRAYRPEPEFTVQAMKLPLQEFCLLGAALKETVNILLPHLGSLTTLRLDHYGFHELEVDVVLRSCPQLENLFLKRVLLVAVSPYSTPLSSLDLTWGARGPLVPSLSDKFLRLKVLKVILCRVHLSKMVDILAVCPKLVELSFVVNFLNDTRCNPETARNISHDEFVSFLGLACRHLRRVHYSRVDKRLEANSARALLHDNPNVTEWSFLPRDLDPFLGSQLRLVQNVITSLEIADFRQHRSTVQEGLDLMQTAVHQFLCNAPLLKRLKMNRMNCAAGRLDPFPLDLQFEPRQLSTAEDAADSTTEPRVWACRNLHSLTLRFTLSHSVDDARKHIASDVRVVFGYLSRVCPKLRHVDIGLDRHSLNLQSGLCLVSRMKHLEVLIIEMQSKTLQWSRGADLSWMDPRLSRLSTFRQQWEMKKWGLIVEKEQELIQRRLGYLERWQTSRQTHQGDKVEDGGAELAHSLALLGTLTDVNNCMKEIAESKGNVYHDCAVYASRSTPRVNITRDKVKTCALDALSLDDY